LQIIQTFYLCVISTQEIAPRQEHTSKFICITNQTRWCALVHVWCKLVIVWCTVVFFGAVFVRIGAVWCTYGGENKQNVPHYRHHPFPMPTFAEQKKHASTCVKDVQHNEHRTTQRNRTKQTATPAAIFNNLSTASFHRQKTEATVLAASVRKIRFTYLRSISLSISEESYIACIILEVMTNWSI